MMHGPINIFFFLFLTIYNPTFLSSRGELETSIIASSGFIYAIWQFGVFYRYSCEGALMVVATLTGTSR